MSVKLEDKKIFLIASADQQRINFYNSTIHKHLGAATMFLAHDAHDCFFKMSNVPPHVLIVDNDIPKGNGIEVAQQVLNNPEFADTAIIIVSELPDREHFVDEVVTGRVQFLTESLNEDKFNKYIARALNFIGYREKEEYALRFLTPDEFLFREGDPVDSVYIVKKGELQALKGPQGQETVLGQISIGEFVGEMAHINNTPRSATVKALTDCELIEIPHGTLDTILFTKPAWSKALVSTLSKRLARSNKQLAKN